jgi:hypothetical protein
MRCIRKRPAPRRLLNCLIFLALAGLLTLPASVVFFYITTYGVNVTMYDQWDFVPTIRRFYQGRLSVADLFQQYDEQRLFFPRIVMLLVVMFASYNNLVEMYISGLFLVVGAALIFLMYMRGRVFNWTTLLQFAPVPLVLFSLRQWNSLLWGWQVQWYLAITFFLLAVYMLDSCRRIGPRFVLAVLSGVVSSFSLAAGLLTWPVGFVHILLQRSREPKGERSAFRHLAVLWIISGAIVFVLYFKDYQPPHFQQSPAYLIAQPLSTARFVLLALGGALAMQETSAFALGLLLAPCYVASLVSLLKSRSRLAMHSALPFSLILFSLLFVAQITVGRSWLGPDKAMESKYAPITGLGLIGLYLLTLSISSTYDRLRRVAPSVLAGIIAIEVMTTNLLAVPEAERMRDEQGKYAYYLSTYRLQDDENLSRLGHPGDYVRNYAPVLERYGLTVFSEPRLEFSGLKDLAAETPLYVDAVNGQVAPQTAGARVDSSRDPTIAVSGWAVDGVAGTAAGGAFIDINGRLQVPARYGLDRRDVADDLKNNSYRYSGFHAEFATRLLRAGRHTLTMMAVSADKLGYYRGKHTVALEIR